MSQYPPLKLLPHQVNHYKKILEILGRFYFYVDGSKQGTGKTIVATAVAITLKLPVIVVCPLTVRNFWQEVLTRYGVKTYQLPETGGIITYNALRAQKGHQPKHGLLTRQDNPLQFYPTPTYNEILRNGVLLIFDEISELKNASAQNHAARSLIRHIYSVGGNSRVALLSGTPIDKEEQVINFSRMVGFITRPKLYTKHYGNVTFEGIQDLIDWGNRISPQCTYPADFEPTPKGAVEYVFKIFINCIRSNIISIMPNPLDTLKDIKNGFYFLELEDDKQYQEGIRELAAAVHYRPPEIEETQDARNFPLYQFTETSLGLVNLSIRKMQMAKVNAMVRVARERLNKVEYDPEGLPIYPKVVLFASYYDVIDILLSQLAEFNPVELTGRVSETQRAENIRVFQQLDNTSRVFIGHPKAGGKGISIHDTSGLFPRYMYIMPDFDINNLMQASDRTTRIGMMGKSYVRFFYGRTGKREEHILALIRKGKVMKEMTIEQTVSGAQFPDDFQDEYEILPSESLTSRSFETSFQTLHI